MRAPPKRKYRNVRITVDGQSYDSLAEHRRFQALQLLERAGAISGLTRQVAFELAPKVTINGKTKRALIYRADFAYTDVKTGQRIIEDVKGAPLTAVYKIKRHLLMHLHGLSILETK